MEKRKIIEKKRESVPLTHNPFASVLKRFKIKTNEKENKDKEKEENPAAIQSDQ